MNCPYCRADIAPQAVQCDKCGGFLQPLPVGQPAGSPYPAGYGVGYASKSKVLAGLLGIFLGGLGIHRFYLGYVGIGLVQLLLTVLTCGFGVLVSWVWGIVEGIMILAGSIDQDAQGRPLRD